MQWSGVETTTTTWLSFQVFTQTFPRVLFLSSEIKSFFVVNKKDSLNTNQVAEKHGNEQEHSFNATSYLRMSPFPFSIDCFKKCESKRRPLQNFKEPDLIEGGHCPAAPPPLHLSQFPVLQETSFPTNIANIW